MIVLLLSYIGLIAGLLVGFMASEELKQGHRYFRIAQFTLLTLSCAFTTFTLFFVLQLYTLSFVILFIIALYTLYKSSLYGVIVSYVVLSIPFFIVSSPQFQQLLAIGIFLFGLPAGSVLLSYEKHITEE